MSESKKQYHIEGLRGLSIIFIILFHINGKCFPMGYLGVDVFLVISGYLLFLRPIQKEGQNKGQASWSFIRRKAGRLMWPLSVAAILTLGVSYFMLVPKDLVATAKTTTFALLGASNIYLGNLDNGGYFAADASFNMMVPTWYLSLMCQVYLLFWVGWLLIPRKWIKVAAIAGFVLSLGCANWETLAGWWHALSGGGRQAFHNYPGYYSFGTRMWEVLAGGAVCLLPPLRSKHFSRFIGLASLAAMLFLLFFSTEARNMSTIFMVLASVFCIRYAGDGWAKSCLENPVLLWVGKISFSIYLVHMIVATSIACFFCQFGAVTMAVAFLTVLALSLPFHLLVEKKRYPLCVSMASWALALIASIVLSKSKLHLNDWLWKDYHVEKEASCDCRCPHDDSLYAGLDTEKLPVFSPLALEKKHFLLLGDKAEAIPDFVLIGDSHASSLYFGLDAFCRKHGLAGVYLTAYVVPIDQWELSFFPCTWNDASEQALFQWLKAHPEITTVVLSQRWYLRLLPDYRVKRYFRSLSGESAQSSIRNFFIKLNELGKKVVVTSCTPELQTQDPNRSFLYSQRFGAISHMESLRCSKADYLKQMSPCIDLLKNLQEEGLCHIVHVEDPLFADGVFEVYQDGNLLMGDTNHLSPAGAEKVTEGCAPRLLQLLAPTDNESR